MSRRIVAITAGLSQPSSTRLLTDRIVASVQRQAGDGVEVQVIEVRDLATDITSHLLTGFPSQRLGAALDAVAGADALIAVTPVFTASYSGLFKSFVDLIDKEALHEVPVLIAATAGTSRHSLVTEYALRPLFSYLRAQVLPTAVFAATDDFADDALSRRIDRAAGELARALSVEAPRARVNSWSVDTGPAIADVPGAPASTPYDEVPDFRALLGQQIAQ